MALSIKHPEADRLARQLAAQTGESLTDAVLTALRERLIREQGRTTIPRLRDELRAIRHRCAQLPVLDTRSPDEILDYDENGLPRSLPFSLTPYQRPFGSPNTRSAKILR